MGTVYDKFINAFGAKNKKNNNTPLDQPAAEEQKQPAKRNCITIEFYNGRMSEWAVSIWDTNDLEAEWLEFIEWFTCKDTPTYTWHASNSILTFQRKDIFRYEICVK